MKKYHLTHIFTLLYVVALFNISFLYFLGHPQQAYLLFMFTLCLFSILLVTLSLYSLAEHNASILCTIGCMHGTSLLFMTLVTPLTWCYQAASPLRTSLTNSLFLQAFILFVLLFCLATLLVVHFFNQPILCKKVCLSFMTFTVIIFTLYLVVNHTFIKMQFIPSAALIFYVMMLLIIMIGTLLFSIHIALKKNVFEEKYTLPILLNLALLSFIILLTYGLSHFIPLYAYMVILLTSIFLFFKLIIHYSIFEHSQGLIHKLALHHHNTQLMNAYLNHLSQEQQALSEQYHCIENLYAQMKLFYPTALFMIVDQTIQHANEHAKILLQYEDLNDLLNTCFMRYIAPKDRPLVQDTLSDLYAHTLDFKTIEVNLITSTGELRDVELYLTLSSDTKTHALIVSAKDISDKKQKDQLQHAIEFEKMKLEFFCTISHDLKTPINIIYSAAQLQNNFIAHEDYEKLPPYNTMIEQNCMRLLKLLNNFLDINRLESRYFNTSPRTLNIVALTENILDSILSYTEQRQITALFDTDDEEIYCTVDPELMERILLNLFSNAIKYGHEEGHIWVTVTHDAQFAYIHVKDDGIGIPEKSLALIFERFTRIENGLVQKADGSGIGLSLVKAFVELNHGTIEVHSQLHEGTEFILKFPIETDANLLAHTDPLDTTSCDKVDIEFSDLPFHS